MLTAVAIQGAQKVSFDACVGLAIYEVASLVLYVVSPKLATFQESISPTTSIARLGGLGHLSNRHNGNFVFKYSLERSDRVRDQVAEEKCDFSIRRDPSGRA